MIENKCDGTCKINTTNVCASCGAEIPHDEHRYHDRGNYCPTCNSRAGELSVARHAIEHWKSIIQDALDTGKKEVRCVKYKKNLEGKKKRKIIIITIEQAGENLKEAVNTFKELVAECRQYADIKFDL